MYRAMCKKNLLIIPMLLLAVGLSSCNTTKSGGASPDNSSASKLQKLPKVTVQESPGLAVDTLRLVNAEAGGALVLVNGLGTRVLPTLDLVDTPYEQFVQTVAEGLACPFDKVDGYYLIYPPGYEGLRDITVSRQLPEAYQAIRGDFIFGEGTRLYNVFAVLNQTIGTNLVADQSVGDAACGEMVLVDVSLPVALDAILRGARVAPGGVQVDAYDDYVLFRSLPNAHPDPLLLGGDTLTPGQRAMLSRKVTVQLPAPINRGKGLQVLTTARSLRMAMRSLSQQLGVQVTSDPALLDLPVNNAHLNDISIQSLIEVVIRQWLVPDFVYEVGDNTITLRRRIP